MEMYQIVKVLHILSSSVLFGTGIGIAFFMFRSVSVSNVHEKFYAVRNTVLADYLFTFPAAVVQPITGAWLIIEGGYDWLSLWLVLSYVLYIIAALCWIPVVWLQIQIKKMLINSIKNNTALSDKYFVYFRVWFFLGWPAFIGLLLVYFLMVIKPQ